MQPHNCRWAAAPAISGNNEKPLAEKIAASDSEAGSSPERWAYGPSLASSKNQTLGI